VIPALLPTVVPDIDAFDSVDGDSSATDTRGADSMAEAGDRDESHERLLRLAARKGAKLGLLMRTIESTAVERRFPLESTAGHPFPNVVAEERRDDAAAGDQNPGRLRDVVRKAAAQGLNLLISPNDGGPTSTTSSSPEGHASGPGSSPGDSRTPGHPSPPGMDEGWSEILNPVKTTWEAKVTSMRHSALTDLGKMVQKLPPEARESASSMLGMLGSGGGERKRQTVVTREGHLYEGEVNDDGQMKRDGYGRLTWPDGHTFQGEFVAGETCGLGRRAWPTGHAFSGMEQKGAKHGLGIYTWPDGRRYEGEFRFDVKDGVGLMRWPNDRCYLGEWKQGLQNGEGIEWRADGSFLTVYEAGRMVLDQEAPASLEARLAAILAASSIVPLTTVIHMNAGANTHPTSGAVEDFVYSTTLSPRPHLECPSVAPLLQTAASPNQSEGRTGRRRGSARQVRRHAAGADDCGRDAGGDEESDCESTVSIQAAKPRWNLSVVNGEVVAMPDSMTTSPLSTDVATSMSFEAACQGENNTANLMVEEADLLTTFSADKRCETSSCDNRRDARTEGVRKSLLGMVMGVGGVPVTSKSDCPAATESDRVEQNDDDSSCFDESPTSRSSSDSSETRQAQVIMCVYMYIYTYIHVYLYTYIYKYMYTYTYMHI